MSNPDPHNDPENVRVEDSKFAPKLNAKKKKMAKKMSLAGKLKSMLNDKPATLQGQLDWFKKHK